MCHALLCSALQQATTPWQEVQQGEASAEVALFVHCFHRGDVLLTASVELASACSSKPAFS